MVTVLIPPAYLHSPFILYVSYAQSDENTRPLPHTVIQRIFYTVNRSWTGRITAHELRRSNFLETLAALEEESDINQVTDYFSYEHFYVIYCKFWELDTDHNLLIDHRDLAKYNYHGKRAETSRIVERLFSGAVSRYVLKHRMSYAEFVWFLISEEDKKTPTSVEYWFRCMDLDGDGVLSMYELEHFYQEQSHRLEAMGVDPLPFHDLMCQVLDLVRPQRPGMITLQDLKRCGMAHVFYDTFFSLEKYLEHEQRDPFVERAGREVSDWCRFAAEEYEVLVAEESESEHLEDECVFICRKRNCRMDEWMDGWIDLWMGGWMQGHGAVISTAASHLWD
uniref:EF-hand domain-containing protein n=1 Tax=Paramormyrops kingsleyae TaxID=1676925 RepID=A0A3B3R046_9TELE